VIGGYTQAPKNFDAILVGYYEGKKLLYTAKVEVDLFPPHAKPFSNTLRS
jgi:hypothetical protein